MVTTRSKNHVTTPALVVSLSLAGYVACPVEPEDKRAAADTRCPRCQQLLVTVTAYERGDSYRLVLRCVGCRWTAEA